MRHCEAPSYAADENQKADEIERESHGTPLDESRQPDPCGKRILNLPRGTGALNHTPGNWHRWTRAGLDSGRPAHVQSLIKSQMRRLYSAAQIQTRSRTPCGNATVLYRYANAARDIRNRYPTLRGTRGHAGGSG